MGGPCLRGAQAGEAGLTGEGGSVGGGHHADARGHLPGLGAGHEDIAAGLGSGSIPDLTTAAASWQQERAFKPEMVAADRERLYAGWKTAIGRIRS